MTQGLGGSESDTSRSSYINEVPDKRTRIRQMHSRNNVASYLILYWHSMASKILILRTLNVGAWRNYCLKRYTQRGSASTLVLKGQFLTLLGSLKPKHRERSWVYYNVGGGCQLFRSAICRRHKHWSWCNIFNLLSALCRPLTNSCWLNNLQNEDSYFPDALPGHHPW